MGPDGCLSSAADNAGLVEDTSAVLTIIESAWQESCDKISRADFWVLWAKLIVEYTALPQQISIDFQFGRKDNLACEIGAGRLPSAQKGITEITRVFVTQMGLTINDAGGTFILNLLVVYQTNSHLSTLVTLLGGHTLGHVHTATSGYGQANADTDILINAWDPTPNVFDNKYFSSMIDIVSNHFSTSLISIHVVYSYIL
jgi:catalase (peroxidase I)